MLEGVSPALQVQGHICFQSLILAPELLQVVSEIVDLGRGLSAQWNTIISIKYNLSAEAKSRELPRDFPEWA